MNEAVRRLVREDLGGAKHYRSLCPETLDRVAGWAAARYPKGREAAAAARRKLHQVCGAFVDESALRRAGERLDGDPPQALQDTCRYILSCHASTAERLPIMEEVYAGIAERMAPPATVLDLCCGLHPFARPWMRLPPGVRYEASDIDTRLVALLTRFFARHVPGATATTRDLLASDAPLEADLVLLMKSLTTLEQQDKGAGAALLDRIRARTLVASFPGRTLGGRNVGMAANYAETWEPKFTAAGWRFTKLPIESEAVYVLVRP